MHLFDNNCNNVMERGTQQRKTVYRISLTLVKKDILNEGPNVDGVPAYPRPANPKVEVYRQEDSVEVQRNVLMDELKEVDAENDDCSLHSHSRNFRTFSTGQLEFGRLKLARRTPHLLNQNQCVNVKETEVGTSAVHNAKLVASSEGAFLKGSVEGKCEIHELVSREKLKGDNTATFQVLVVNGGSTLSDKISRRNAKCKGSKSSEQFQCSQELRPNEKLKTCSPWSCKVSDVHSGLSQQLLHTLRAERQTSVLRRSLSFRHWTAGELLRIGALSKQKHHCSSGCIGRREDAISPVVVGLQNSTFSEGHDHESLSINKKQNLNEDKPLLVTDSSVGLSRTHRAKGKNCTLDNSDLMRLSDHPLREKEGFLQATGGHGGGQDRRLVRFFSGIFAKRDFGLWTSTTTPFRSPSNCGLCKRHGHDISHASSESVSGSKQAGKSHCFVCHSSTNLCRAGKVLAVQLM